MLSYICVPNCATNNNVVRTNNVTSLKTSAPKANLFNKIPITSGNNPAILKKAYKIAKLDILWNLNRFRLPTRLITLSTRALNSILIIQCLKLASSRQEGTVNR